MLTISTQIMDLKRRHEIYSRRFTKVSEPVSLLEEPMKMEFFLKRTTSKRERKNRSHPSSNEVMVYNRGRVPRIFSDGEKTQEINTLKITKEYCETLLQWNYTTDL